MKKIFKFISLNLMFILCIVSVCGCGCSKPLNINYAVKVEGENIQYLEIRTVVTKKFREPADTACYEKTENGYKLIEDAEEISNCYDKDGNQFEKATYKNFDKVELDRFFPKIVGSSTKKYTANKNYEVPENEKYSLIFEIEVRNKDVNLDNQTEIVMFVKELYAKDLFGDQLKEDSLKKVSITYPKEMQAIEENDYFVLRPNSSITFKIELKGLTNKDTSKKVENITLNFPVILK